MMAVRKAPTGLIGRLPPIRGVLEENADSSRFTWFRTGGPAEVLYNPADPDDLAAFLMSCPGDIPLTVIGVGSNLLVRDGGIGGVVIRLGRGFAGSRIENGAIFAGGGLSDVRVASTARRAGLGGLEFLSGIPGTIGGAVRMNAGAYGKEIKDVLIDATVLGRDGSCRVWSAQQLGFSYRCVELDDEAIVIGARLRTKPADPGLVGARMDEIRLNREASQPLRTRTGGSTFRNPPGEKAWVLIDRSGCRGLRRGGAMVSEKHCNFLVNTGGASATDIEGLGEHVRQRVRAETGVTLAWEIRRIGRPLPGFEGAA